MNLFILIISFAMSGQLATINPPVTEKKINVAESTVEWMGHKVLGSHNGNIDVKEGSLNFDENNVLTGGGFSIDMTSITVKDLEPNKGGKKLEGHLKSADFFGVEKFPTAQFKITKVVSRGKTGEYKIIGDLTIKETTKEIKFDAVVNNNVASTSLKIDRSDFDIRYGSGSFFDNLGDKTIYDEFDLNISLAF